jgi:hypothetical protein
MSGDETRPVRNEDSQVQSSKCFQWDQMDTRKGKIVEPAKKGCNHLCPVVLSHAED